MDLRLSTLALMAFLAPMIAHAQLPGTQAMDSTPSPCSSVVAPNPTRVAGNAIVTITPKPADLTLHLALYDMQGARVLAYDVPVVGEQSAFVPIMTSQLFPGWYLYSITNRQGHSMGVGTLSIVP